MSSRGQHIRNIVLYMVPVIIGIVLIIYVVNNARSPEGSIQPEPNQDQSNINRVENDVLPPTTPVEDIPSTDPIPSDQKAEIKSLPDNSDQSTAPPEEQSQSPFLLENARSVTPKDGFIYPRFSPDGMDIICSKHKFRGIYLVSADGSEIRQISDEIGIGYNVKWSADGTKIIVEKDGKTKVLDITGEEIDPEEVENLPDQNVFAKDDNIYLKNPDTGEDINLTNGEDAFFDPQVSPEGDKVAYQGLSTGIHIKNLETGEVVDLGQGTNMKWMPDGSGVIYNFTQDDGMDIIAGDIYFAYPDGSGAFNITNTPDIIELNPSISPDGSYLTYEVDGQVFIADLTEVAQ